MNAHQDFIEGPHISQTSQLFSDLQDPPMKLLDTSLKMLSLLFIKSKSGL
jgi:hypothetical protein